MTPSASVYDNLVESTTITSAVEHPMYTFLPTTRLETSRLGRGRDTRLFSLIRPTQRALTSRVDGTHRLDLSLGLFVVLPLLDTRVSVRFGSSRGETTVLLDRTSERTRTVGRFRLCKCASTGRTRRAGQLIVRKHAE